MIDERGNRRHCKVKPGFCKLRKCDLYIQTARTQVAAVTKNGHTRAQERTLPATAMNGVRGGEKNATLEAIFFFSMEMDCSVEYTHARTCTHTTKSFSAVIRAVT